MRKPITLRPLTAEEQQAVQAGRRSPQSFTVRRGQILLASQRGCHARPIADQLSCGDQTVRNVLHALNRRGLASLQPQSKAPRHRPQAVFTAARREQLRDLLHQSPRAFGHPTSLWTLPLAAQVAYAEGITPREVSGEAIRQALQRLRVGWKRAKHWIQSPDPGYLRKKRRDRLIARAETHPTWALGFADEVWWSRLAQPRLHSWVPGGKALRLVEKTAAPWDPDPKALACYGLLLRATATTPEQVWLRVTRGQPVSGITVQFLAWCSDRLAVLGKQALLLIWDNASWHRSHEVQRWLRTHNQQVKQTRQGVRLVSCRLPTKSPWLNPIEPKWVHGKRAIVEPERGLTAAEVQARVSAYYRCQPEPLLLISQQAA